jgi:hypothetical protein
MLGMSLSTEDSLIPILRKAKPRSDKGAGRYGMDPGQTKKAER